MHVSWEMFFIVFSWSSVALAVLNAKRTVTYAGLYTKIQVSIDQLLPTVFYLARCCLGTPDAGRNPCHHKHHGPPIPVHVGLYCLQFHICKQLVF